MDGFERWEHRDEVDKHVGPRIAFVSVEEKRDGVTAGLEIRNITPIHDNFGTSIVEGVKQRTY